MLDVVVGRAAPLWVKNNAIIIRVPSHVILQRNGCHRPRRRHLHARFLVSDPEYLLHRLYIKDLLDSCLRFLRCLQFESGHLRGPLMSDASQLLPLV